ncbi:MAG: hypothetical protein MOIL_00376 [Candidatus Methanolliviera sp. GoM_oil]|nr:MAG: hypothetical protein MOIL_00376 [Candidatus Methanolliviera sp. GoM_oil]
MGKRTLSVVAVYIADYARGFSLIEKAITEAREIIANNQINYSGLSFKILCGRI